MSGFFKIRDFFLKSVLRKTADFSVSDTGDPLILTYLMVRGHNCWEFDIDKQSGRMILDF